MKTALEYFAMFCAGNTFSVFTNNEYRFNYTWLQPTGNHLMFNVRTCDNVHVLLSTALMNVSAEMSYEVVIGGYDNTISDIRKGAHGPIVVQVDTPNILKCDEFLPFWIKWENSAITVGHGDLGSNVFMQYSEANMASSFVATVSSWTTAPAEYHFLESQGKKLRHMLLDCFALFAFLGLYPKLNFIYNFEVSTYFLRKTFMIVHFNQQVLFCYFQFNRRGHTHRTISPIAHFTDRCWTQTALSSK